jgi:catechol 2,3-dioxygenase-like lactoylglutathione lyase family enzyme
MKRTRLLFLLPLFWLISLVQAAPKRPEIRGIAYVRIFTSNLVSSRKFYAEILRPGDQTQALLTSNGWNTDPSSWPKSLPRLQVELVQQPSPAPANLVDEVVFLTDNVSALKAYLVSEGVAIHPSKEPDKHLQVVDPEGHRIGFVEEKKPSPAKESSISSWPIIHAGFVVRDRVATDHFYKDILGFRPYWHGGMKDDKDDWVAMQVPDGTDWVEYMLNISPTADKHTLGVMNHIAIGVNDIHATEQEVLKNGVKLSEEPKLGRDGKWQLNLYDPDDTRVEFMEFTPKEKPCCSEFTGPHPGPKQ